MPSLEHWSSQILVPFRAYRLRNARILWLNQRWFNERHIDLLDRVVYKRVSRSVIEAFAYIAPNVEDRKYVNYADSRHIYADRYGSSTGLALHGGSGRVAVVGRFQVKGIGQTPLVGRGAPTGHSHGCMSLAEAVREAIFAEIAAAEFPSGSVPVMAIIDTGLTFSSHNPEDIYDQNVPRVLAVRPTVVRIAHAERAPLFKDSVTGFTNVQAMDALRTKQVIDTWMTSVKGKSRSPEAATLQSAFDLVAKQIAFGQVHRLFTGGYFSSNLTIDGRLLDFGNMHALPDWSRAQVHSVVEGFGQETTLLRHLVNSIAFYVTKYRRCGDAIQMAGIIYDGVQASYRSAWKKYCLNLFQAEIVSSSVQEAICSAVWRYYSQQQRRRVKYRFGHGVAETASAPGWIYSAVVDADHSSPSDLATLNEVDRILRLHVSSEQRSIAWHTAARLLRPRENLDRRILLNEIAELTLKIKAANFPYLVKSYIAKAVDWGRRYWPNLPNGYAVLGHVTRDGSSALLVSKPQNGVWIEGIFAGAGSLTFFDEQLTKEEGMILGIQKYGEYWSAVLETEAKHGELYFSVRDRMVRVPPMTIIYEPPAKRWLS